MIIKLYNVRIYSTVYLNHVKLRAVNCQQSYIYFQRDIHSQIYDVLFCVNMNTSNWNAFQCIPTSHSHTHRFPD